MNILRTITAAAVAGGILLASAGPAIAQELPIDAPAVQMQGNTFLPGDGFIPAGTTVVFANLDGEAHDVVPMDPYFNLDIAFFSPVIDPGQGWAFTFTVPGVYAYMCDLHANMTGTITVA